MENKIRAIVIFPYGGLSKYAERSDLFFRMLETLIDLGDDKIVVVIEHDTISRHQQSLKKFRDHIAINQWEDQIEELRVWSVDTCQMWLHGWGHVLDSDLEANRIIQLPGDLSALKETDCFFKSTLQRFYEDAQGDIIIGDFTTGERHGAKDLIDAYGTFPLMQNWFPGATKSIWTSDINHPRSEFLNLSASTLRDLLAKTRKFAYEQTLNLLIQIWHDCEGEKVWNKRVGKNYLGEIRDDSGFRNYRECLDQIERTERMLKVLWRERYWGDGNVSEDNKLEFERLDRRSTAIRENARIIIQGMLDT